VTSGYALYMAACGARSWFEFLVVLITGDAWRLTVSRWYGRYRMPSYRELRKTDHDFTPVISAIIFYLFVGMLFNSAVSTAYV